MKSLKILNNPLSKAGRQVEILEQEGIAKLGLPRFKDKLGTLGFQPLKPSRVDILQVNVGKMCNQVCKHCHVDAGPDRKEIMTWDTMEHCLNALRTYRFSSIDITGGAPEMNPHFRRFIESVRLLDANIEIIVRCNLTIILANKKYHDLPDFFKENNITVVSSLPYFESGKTDRQRGEGVFDKSIEALRMLNQVGYGQESTGLRLHLVYNPAGAFLPGSEEMLQARFKEVLLKNFGIVFNDLYAITNLPISRFLDYLLESGNYEDYMEKLVEAFNPNAVPGVMCRNTLSVGWDGYLYDCDFNQMLELTVQSTKNHIRSFDPEELNSREIVINEHCYGCTAGSGSSCGGTVV
jgi:radical SAM/Cys-rich protein